MYLHDQLVHKTIIEGCTGSRNHCTGFPDAPHRNLEKTALSEWNIHLMADILGKHTQMRVLQAENEMPVRPNTVYLIPPKNNLTLRGGKLYLTEFNHSMLNHPIDIFFTSLAEEQRERAIAIVLSGTGSAGTSGIKVVKEHGGLVIVQNPDSAKFDGMPRSAINTGLADFILSPDGIVDEILNFSSYPTIIRPEEKEELFSDD